MHYHSMSGPNAAVKRRSPRNKQEEDIRSKKTASSTNEHRSTYEDIREEVIGRR